MEIKGMDPSVAELLEAAGYLSVDAFKNHTAGEIHDELVRANSMLSLVENVPSMAQIEKWLQDAEGGHVPASSNEEISGGSRSTSQSFSEDEGLRDIESGEEPFAQPLSSKFIAKHRIDVESLPPMLETNAKKVKLQQSDIPRERISQEAVISSSQQKAIEKERIRSIEEARGEKVAYSAIPKKNGAVDRTKVVNPETNKGVDPHSRKYIRGVLHNDPRATSLGAYAFVLALALLLVGVLPIIYIIVNREDYLWGLLSPVFLVIVLVLYFGLARRSSCPVCRQRQFVPKSCLKHNKAHHIKGLGYMVPTALHLICYKWFRCIFCGTSIRVKE